MTLHVELFEFAMQGEFGFWGWLAESAWLGCIAECALITCWTWWFLNLKSGAP